MRASIGGPAGGGRGRMSITISPERDLGLAGSIIKARYKLNAIATVSREVVVYAAEEIRFGRPVLLKVLRDTMLADAEFVAAVREQASALAISPHVRRGLPRVYECGTTDSGRLFLALEQTKGPTLREVMDARGPLDPPSALRIASQVGEALETLHHSQIVHGQLAPESVLLVKDADGTERVTLVDVEMTAAYKILNSRRRPSASPYLAPEQLEGGVTTQATDQYALAMLLRELVTGAASHDPIDVDTAMPALPPDMERIITTGLASRPELRFPDISVMVNDMWAVQTAFPEPEVRATAVTARTDSHRRVRRRSPRTGFRIAAAVATAGIIAAVVWLALSGVMAARLRALLSAPAVSVVPAVEDPATLPIQLSVPAAAPVPVPPRREPTVSPAPRPTNASTADGTMHPSAAPRPAPVVEREPLKTASPPVDRPVRSVVESGKPVERPAPADHAGGEGKDGSAIIDWVLNRRGAQPGDR